MRENTNTRIKVVDDVVGEGTLSFFLQLRYSFIRICNPYKTYGLTIHNSYITYVLTIRNSYITYKLTIRMFFMD